jgi:hypothetical protein
MRLHGIDFTSAPRRGKPIAVASGSLAVGRPVLRVDSIEPLVDFSSFEAWLCRPGPWLAVFDLPFGLPRELLEALGWLAPATLCGAPPGGCERTGAGEPVSAGERTVAGAEPADLEDDSPWACTIRRVAALPRPEFVSLLRGFCAARPPGGKFAHRRADGPAGSSPSMKWVNPPVALMLHAATPRLLAAGVCLPGLHRGDPERIALEGYPGHLARAIVGRTSYKSDAAAGRTPQRRAAREAILSALRTGEHPLGLIVDCDPPLAQSCLDDATADRLDALLCLVQAAWAWQRRDEGFGLPEAIDPVEGWIVSVPDIDAAAGSR